MYVTQLKWIQYTVTVFGADLWSGLKRDPLCCSFCLFPTSGSLSLIGNWPSPLYCSLSGDRTAVGAYVCTCTYVCTHHECEWFTCTCDVRENFYVYRHIHVDIYAILQTVHTLVLKIHARIIQDFTTYMHVLLHHSPLLCPPALLTCLPHTGGLSLLTCHTQEVCPSSPACHTQEACPSSPACHTQEACPSSPATHRRPVPPHLPATHRRPVPPHLPHTGGLSLLTCLPHTGGLSLLSTVHCLVPGTKQVPHSPSLSYTSPWTSYFLELQ